MTNSDDEAQPSHAPGSQPSVHPGSDEPQTITAPTPPVAWSSGAPDPADLTAEEDESDGPRGEAKTTPQSD
ncbi:hypothetical protein GCM10010335_14020 [Streptomyces galbus]|nr:hypothetical protein GCM10010335_14020 [Streptomyces galbus]